MTKSLVKQTNGLLCLTLFSVEEFEVMMTLLHNVIMRRLDHYFDSNKTTEVVSLCAAMYVRNVEKYSAGVFYMTEAEHNRMAFLLDERCNTLQDRQLSLLESQHGLPRLITSTSKELEMTISLYFRITQILADDVAPNTST